MVSKSLITVKDKPPEPELEGNIRTVVWDSTAARKAVVGEDDQMSAGDLAAMLLETSRVSIEEIDRLIVELRQPRPCWPLAITNIDLRNGRVASRM